MAASSPTIRSVREYDVMADWLPYERGQVVRDTRDDHAKLREAWRSSVTGATPACRS